jgi:hypothetical protein
MKIVLFSLLTVATAAVAFKAADNIISQLGIGDDTANWYIQHNIVGSFSSSSQVEEDRGTAGNSAGSIYEQLSHFRLPYCRELPAIIAGDKAAAASKLCTYVKDYVSGPAFKAEYEKEREAAKPTSEPYRPDSATLQAQKDAIKQMEDLIPVYKNTAGVPASSITEMEKGIQQMKKDMAASEDPTPNKTKWMKQYPQNPELLVKARLQEYISLVATVDFSAKLTGTGKNQKFVNPEYEKKSLKWKAIYRAGKETNTVVTAFVKDWLKTGVHIAQ